MTSSTTTAPKPSTFIAPESESVVVHPLVLLSVVDHYSRMGLSFTPPAVAATQTPKRVVGILLGYWTGRCLNVTNSYALPFEEGTGVAGSEDPNVWYLDHNYHECMVELFKKVSAKEKPIGWYHSGPKLRGSDCRITELLCNRYKINPTLVVIDPTLPSFDRTTSEAHEPIKSYFASKSLDDTEKVSFSLIPTVIEGEESEEVGVEHLLRDQPHFNQRSSSSYSQTTTTSKLGVLSHKTIDSLRSLERHLSEIEAYLQRVEMEELPLNQDILTQIQDIFGTLPSLYDRECKESLMWKTNDHMALAFLASLSKPLLALQSLIDNKSEGERALFGQLGSLVGGDSGSAGDNDINDDDSKKDVSV